MKIQRWLLPQFLTVIAGILMFGGQAYASSTAGSIKGLVIDDGGGALPGAVVTLSSPVLIGGAQQRKTDEDGRFIFVELPPGSYQMVFAREGFGTVTRKSIAVGLGRTVDLTVELKYGGAQVDVIDTGAVIDQDSTTSGQNFNSDFLSRVPSGRTYQDVVNNTPGVVDNGSGNPNSGGASYNENSFMLDGVNITDPVTGTFSMNFNFDSIDEVQVVTTGFDPEYNALGATISVVTKSGGNSMEVVTNAFYTNGNWSPQYDAQFASDGSTLSPTGFDRERQYGSVGFQISGPVVKDRVWFLGSYEYNRTLIASAGVPLPRDFDSHYFYGKLTAQPVSSHLRLELRRRPHQHR
jgi:Carboxypeptidase regulatory-like domain/TonB-dependent Receptor Plug Domain